MFGCSFRRRNSHSTNHIECEKKSGLRSLFPGMWSVLTSLRRYFGEKCPLENLRLVWHHTGHSQGILYRQSRNVAHAVRWHAFCPRRAITAVHIKRLSDSFYFSCCCCEVKIRHQSFTFHRQLFGNVCVAQTQKRSHRSV